MNKCRHERIEKAGETRSVADGSVLLEFRCCDCGLKGSTRVQSLDLVWERDEPVGPDGLSVLRPANLADPADVVHHKLVWEFLGEGLAGDFETEREGDVPLLRAAYFIGDEAVEGGSWCTLVPLGAPRREVERLSNLLFERMGSTFSRRVMREWTRETDLVLPKGEVQGETFVCAQESTTEYGYTFKFPESDDVIADLVLGHSLDPAEIEQAFLDARPLADMVAFIFSFSKGAVDSMRDPEGCELRDWIPPILFHAARKRGAFFR